MIELLISLTGFALVTTLTPGPNNLMLMASGANFGFRRTLPHMLGVLIGFALMIFLVGVGLIRVFDAWPQMYGVLKVGCVAYLLFLAWKIATASAPGERQADSRPMSFVQAAAFQWVNPKAWAMGLTAVTIYAPERSLLAVLVVALVFGAASVPSVSVWTAMGQGMRKLLRAGTRLRVFNGVMAVLLVLSLVPML